MCYRSLSGSVLKERAQYVPLLCHPARKIAIITAHVGQVRGRSFSMFSTVFFVFFASLPPQQIKYLVVTKAHSCTDATPSTILALFPCGEKIRWANCLCPHFVSRPSTVMLNDGMFMVLGMHVCVPQSQMK